MDADTFEFAQPKKRTKPKQTKLRPKVKIIKKKQKSKTMEMKWWILESF